MKTMMKMLFSSFLIIVILAGAYGQKNEERKEKRQKAFLECLELIESGEFKFEAEKAYPQGGSSIDLTTNYGFIEVSDKKSTGDLPFFGRAYSVEYGADGGINFEGEILDKKITRDDKKMKATLTYKVRDKESFTVIIDVFSKESASAIIRCESKSHISYSGKIIELKKDD